MGPLLMSNSFFHSSVGVASRFSLKTQTCNGRTECGISVCSGSFLHNANAQRRAQREATDKMFTRRQTGDTGTQKAEGKRGGKKKKNRTCLQGRLKIKRNTIPACIWVAARPPLPPVGRMTRSECSEDLQSAALGARIPPLLHRWCARFIVEVKRPVRLP